MGNGMNKILPGLYIGNFRDAKDEKQLTENNITHIVSVHDNAKKILVDKEYLCIVASDCPDQDLVKFFPQVNKFIHKARLEGGSVLVHCLAGVSRSVTVTAAYIMTVTNLGWRDSLNSIRGARSVANPNFGFQKQLQSYEHEQLEEERRKLKAMFPNNPFKDEEECQINLRCFQQFVLTGNLPSRSDDLYPLPHRAYEGQARREAYNKQTVPGQVESNVSSVSKGKKSGCHHRHHHHHHHRHHHKKRQHDLSKAADLDVFFLWIPDDPPRAKDQNEGLFKDNTDSDETTDSTPGTATDSHRQEQPAEDSRQKTEQLVPTLAVCEDSRLASPSPQPDNKEDGSPEVL